MSSESISAVVPPRVSIDPSSASTTRSVNSSLKRKDGPTTLSSSKAMRPETSHGWRPETSYVRSGLTGTSVTPSQAAARSAAHSSSRVEGPSATAASRVTRTVLPPGETAPPNRHEAPSMHYREVPCGRVPVQGTASDPHPEHRPQPHRQQDQDPVNAESANEIEREVQKILKNQLLGSVTTVKLDALRTVTGYFTETAAAGSQVAAHHPWKEYRRAFSELNGCYLLAVALRQELDLDRPNRDFVLAALEFLEYWYSNPQHRDSSSILFKDIENIGLAMHLFYFDIDIQLPAIRTYFNMSIDLNSELRRNLIEANCIPYLARAMRSFSTDPIIRMYAILILERLCQTRNRSLVKRIVQDGAVVALANVSTTRRDSLGEKVRIMMFHLLGNS